MPPRCVRTTVKDREKGRPVGSGLILIQGVVTALFPQASVRLTKKLLGKNFDNVSQLEATPAYLRQLRAIGVGMVAAGGMGLLLADADDAEGDVAEVAGSEEADGDE